MTRGIVATVDRTVDSWINDGHGLSTIKNTLSMLVRLMEQACRDGLISVNPAHIKNLKRRFKQYEDELLDPRALALPDYGALQQLADTLVERSYNRFEGWGDVVRFTTCTACRIGEASGIRKKDIDRERWIWTVRRQTTPSPGGLQDKAPRAIALAEFRSSPRFDRWSPHAWTPSSLPMAGYLPGHAVGASQPRCCAMRRTG